MYRGGMERGRESWLCFDKAGGAWKVERQANGSWLGTAQNNLRYKTPEVTGRLLKEVKNRISETWPEY